jgi:hypothetical protein
MGYRLCVSMGDSAIFDGDTAEDVMKPHYLKLLKRPERVLYAKSNKNTKY